MVWNFATGKHALIRIIISVTSSPEPLAKRVLPTVRLSASPFNFQHFLKHIQYLITCSFSSPLHFYISFSNVFYKAAPTQEAAIPFKPSFILFYARYSFLFGSICNYFFHKIRPNVLHPSPVPNFKPVQVFLNYFSKFRIFSTKESYSTYVLFYYLLTGKHWGKN